MNINQMHDFIIFLKNEGQGYWTSPGEIDFALNMGSIDKATEEKKQFESTGAISDNLGNFKKKLPIALTSGSGDKPPDYMIRTNASLDNDIPVDIVPESEWVTRINDPIDPPSLERPIAAIRNVIEVRPSTGINSIYLYYLRQPATMVFGYDIVDDLPVYNAGTSTQCDWPVDCHIDIIRRACVYLGIPVDDQSILRLEAYKKQTEAA